MLKMKCVYCNKAAKILNKANGNGERHFKRTKKQNQTNKQKVGHDHMNVQEESHNIYGTSRGLGKIIKAI